MDSVVFCCPSAVEFPFDSRFVFAAPSTLAGSRLVLLRAFKKSFSCHRQSRIPHA